MRRLDELRDIAVLVEDLLHDRADRLVDERDPELVEVGHARNYGCFRRARHASWPATAMRSTAKSLRSTWSGRDSATCAPPTVAPDDGERRSRGPGGSARSRSCCWRHTPTSTVGMIASNEVASAWSCVSPSQVSVGTKRMPPPTPNNPARHPGEDAEHNRDRVRSLEQHPDGDRDEQRRRRGTKASGPAAAAEASLLLPRRAPPERRRGARRPARPRRARRR